MTVVPKPLPQSDTQAVREDVHAEGEPRFVTLGMGAKGRILIVVWTPREDRIRQISSWKANQRQRQRYERQFRS